MLQKTLVNSKNKILRKMDYSVKNYEFARRMSRSESSLKDCLYNDQRSNTFSEKCFKNEKDDLQSSQKKIGFITYVPLLGFDIGKFLGKSKRKIKNETSLLRQAVRSFDEKRLREIIESKLVDINIASSKGITAVHEAAIDGNLIGLKILVDNGADISKVDNEGFTCLDYSVLGGNFECASYLISKGAKTDRVRDGVQNINSYFSKDYRLKELKQNECSYQCNNTRINT
ncbi:protein phosphatase 1 regulatory subunit 12A isoform X2 [Hydra vulgaris]|nr:protein phosphatase 1 regulatory subunit 12A isoform X2 [Hydra vulgaris]